MADKYLADNGELQEVEATTASAGAANAGDIVALNGAGKLDASLFPAGIGGAAVSLVASETLAAGDFVNIWDDAGTPKMRKADATTLSTKAHGFVLDGVSAAAMGTLHFEGQNTALSSLTPGTTYFLSASVPGGVTATPPAAVGNIRQPLGVAYSTTALDFERQRVVVKA